MFVTPLMLLVVAGAVAIGLFATALWSFNAGYEAGWMDCGDSVLNKPPYSWAADDRGVLDLDGDYRTTG